jgi:hypothetical protein
MSRAELGISLEEEQIMGIPLEADSSNNGAAVTGNNSDIGDGVYGFSNNGIGVHGVNNQGAVDDGGVGPKSNCGVFGESDLNEGVFGASAGQHGVHGVSGLGGGVAPPNGCGVYGESHQWPNNAVFGSSNAGHGVHGINGAGSGTSPNAGCGVYGESAKGYGVYGASKSGTAGVFDGNVNVNGNHHVTGAGQFDGAVKVKLDLNVGGNHNVTGNVNVIGDVILTNPGADCAEQFDLKPNEIADPGTVMVIDDTGALRRSCRSYDRAVAGVVSGAGAYRPAIVLDQLSNSQARATIALLGKVYCKVDANVCPIAAGDLLTTSDIPGHAMKATDLSRGFGAVIGKALAPLEAGIGLLPMLIALR